MHAWYAPKIARRRGHTFAVIYARANGKLVLCSVVSDYPEAPITWPGADYIGVVVRYVRAATTEETHLGRILPG